MNRELLELAAKAAGRTKARYVEFWGAMADPAEDGNGFDPSTCWNPFTDNVDALTLAVELRLDLLFDGHDSPNAYIEVSTNLPWDGDLAEHLWVAEPLRGDPLTATRLAIGRVAAEIGRNMK